MAIIDRGPEALKHQAGLLLPESLVLFQEGDGLWVCEDFAPSSQRAGSVQEQDLGWVKLLLQSGSLIGR